MNQTQKMAWLIVLSILVGLVLSVTAVAVSATKYGFPRALAGFGFMGLAGLGGLGPVIFKKDPGPVAFDERDQLIKRRSALAGFAASYLFMGLACMIPFFVLGPKATISVNCLPYIFMGAGISTFFVTSVAVLVLYGKSRVEENEYE
ncbi:MAG: hypothetical protein KAT00_08245 [Planctomycetes bacterium]|nr:hypothetical protein [Planctomycetota bacterium]